MYWAIQQADTTYNLKTISSPILLFMLYHTFENSAHLVVTFVVCVLSELMDNKLEATNAFEFSQSIHMAFKHVRSTLTRVIVSN